MRARTLSGLLTLSAGCSLTSLTELPIVECDDPSAITCNQRVCGDLNKKHGLDPAVDCQLYQYAIGGGCELSPRDWDGDQAVAADCASMATAADCDDRNPLVHPGATELCNGLDDDCDGTVDEGVGLPQGEPRTIPLSSPSVAYGHDDSSAIAAEDGQLKFADLSSANTSSVAPATNRTDALVETDLTPGCPNPDDGVRPSCNGYVEASLARSADTWLMAAVEEDGCKHGRLRVGYLAQEGSAPGALSFIQRGPAERSNLFRSVDLIPGDGGGCTGKSNRDARVGAARPAVAVADTTQAPNIPSTAGVVTWLGDSTSEHAACGGAPVSVQALGVWLEASEADRAHFWVNGANNGVPTELGLTAQGSPPATLALSTDSFLVAAADAGESAIAVWRVQVPAAPRYQGVPGVVRETPNIQVTRLLTVPGSAGANSVSLALSSAAEDGVCGARGRTIGLGFNTGCNGPATQYFAVLGVTDAGQACVSAAPVQLGSFDSAITSSPLAAYHVQSGLVREGFSRGGASASAAQTGGWLLAWNTVDDARRPQVVLSRVLALDGRPLLNPQGQTEQLVVQVNADQPALFTDAETGAPTLAYRSTNGAGVETRPAVCRPAL